MKFGWGFNFSAEPATADRYARLHDHGFVHQVTLPTGPYLDWKVPLLDQPEEVCGLVFRVVSAGKGEKIDWRTFIAAGWTGRDAYELAVDAFMSPEEISFDLGAAGLCGIRYQGTDSLDGIGTTNYVVFDSRSIVSVAVEQVKPLPRPPGAAGRVLGVMAKMKDVFGD